MSEFPFDLNPVEAYSDPSDRTYSPEAAQFAISMLQGCVETLRQLETKGYPKNGKLNYYVDRPALIGLPENSSEWKATLQDSYTAWLTLGFGYGRITSAYILRVLPREGTKRRRDEWHARFQFPEPDYSAGSTPRVVLDTWRMPLTTIEKALKELPRDSFQEFYVAFLRKDGGSGIPAGAEDIQHIVYGRAEYLDQDREELLKEVLTCFTEGVSKAKRYPT
ncbi:MAG: hypothetical protein AAB541_03520 [Patescibacteria group bacterium]